MMTSHSLCIVKNAFELQILLIQPWMLNLKLKLNSKIETKRRGLSDLSGPIASFMSNTLCQGDIFINKLWTHIDSIITKINYLPESSRSSLCILWISATANWYIIHHSRIIQLSFTTLKLNPHCLGRREWKNTNMCGASFILILCPSLWFRYIQTSVFPLFTPPNLPLLSPPGPSLFRKEQAFQRYQSNI